jgi:hypothetical protein
MEILTPIVTTRCAGQPEPDRDGARRKRKLKFKRPRPNPPGYVSLTMHARRVRT